MVLSGPRPAAQAGQAYKFPGRRQRPDRDLDHGRAVAALECPGERGAELRRRAGALGGSPKALREPHEIRIGEIAGDQAVALALRLVAAHGPERPSRDYDGAQG